jgi:hypothetical protein
MVVAFLSPPVKNWIFYYKNNILKQNIKSMKPFLKQGIIYFLFTGLLFASFLATMDYFQGHEFGAWKFFFSVLFFGGFQAGWRTYYMYQNFKKFNIEVPSQLEFKKIQKEEITTSTNPDELRLLIDKNYVNLNIAKFHFEENQVKLNTKGDGVSPSGTITIDILPLGNDKYSYTIESKPNYKLPIHDYGRNYVLVKYLVKMLQKPESKLKVA